MAVFERCDSSNDANFIASSGRTVSSELVGEILLSDLS